MNIYVETLILLLAIPVFAILVARFLSPSKRAQDLDKMQAGTWANAVLYVLIIGVSAYSLYQLVQEKPALWTTFHGLFWTTVLAVLSIGGLVLLVQVVSRLPVSGRHEG